MTSWGTDAFDHEAACEWVLDLEQADDLSVIEQTLERLRAAADGADENFVSTDLIFEALAACETLARLCGRPGEHTEFTEPVDRWIRGLDAARVRPTPEVLTEAGSTVQRLRGDAGAHAVGWLDAKLWDTKLADLQQRLAA